MDLKSFFDLKKVIFSRDELETPYKDKPTDVIFHRENNSSENEPTNVVSSRKEHQTPSERRKKQ